MTELTSRVAPVRGSERIEALDVLRGVAVLGILVMNVQSFALPFAAYSNPSVWTSGDTVDLFFWGFAFLLAEQKFMAIFSLLFGAGVALMLDRLEKRRERTAEAGDPDKVAVGTIHYRRSFGLILIGLAHAYLLWYGDILVTYGLCALVLYTVRRARPSRLLVAGIIVLTVTPLIGQGYVHYLDGLPEEERAVAEAALIPGVDSVEAEVEAYRGGWLQQMPVRAMTAVVLQTGAFLLFVAWRAGGLMLVGMALFKWGVVTARRSPPFYRRLAFWSFSLGFPLVAAGMVVNLASGFEFVAMWRSTTLLNYTGSIGVALAYVALVMLWCHPGGAASGEGGVLASAEGPLGGGAPAPPRPAGTGWATGLRRRLAAVGRMALTNYLLQTILCVLIFYGYGLGLFGHVGRAGQWLVVLAVWAFQLVASPWWLERFRFGPFEWLWRSMTYLRWQPFRRS